MAIDVGDAVLTFLGDTTQLDSAFDRVNEGTVNKLNPANDGLVKMAGNWQFAGSTASAAGEAGMLAGEEVAEGAKLGGHAIREARGEAALLGEEFGIRLPRHVRSFVAELPGVGEALSAAFSATAILFLIEALVKVIEKVTDWITTTFIMTEAMKKSNDAIIEMNKSLLDQKAIYEKVHEQVETFGLTALETTDVKMKKLTDSIHENQLSLNDASNTLHGYRNGWGETAQQAAEASAKVIVLTMTLKEQQETLQLIQDQHDKEQTSDIVKKALASVEAERTVGKAKIELLKANTTLELVQRQASADSIMLIERHYDDLLFANELSATQRKLSILRQGGKDYEEQVRADHAKLEAMEKDHAAKLATVQSNELKSLQETYNNFKKDVQATGPIEIVTPDAAKRITDAANAARLLGVTLKRDLVAALNDAKQAQADFIIGGHGSTAELKQFADKVKEAQTALNNFGKSDSLMKQFFHDIETGAKLSGHAFQDFGKLAAQSTNQFMHAMESGISAWLKGEESLGAALKQATQSVLAELAARSAMYAIYYTAIGIADLATYQFPQADLAFAAAGEFAILAAVTGGAAAAMGHSGGGSSSGGGKTATSASGGVVTSPGQNPVSRTNTLKLAAGGLVTGPTLAELGEQPGAHEEAVIPLNNPQATEKLRQTLGGGGGDTYIIHGMVSPDNMKRVMRQMSRQQKQNQGRISANTSSKLIKRGS